MKYTFFLNAWFKLNELRKQAACNLDIASYRLYSNELRMLNLKVSTKV